MQDPGAEGLTIGLGRADAASADQDRLHQAGRSAVIVAAGLPMLKLVPIPVGDLRLLALAQVPATLALRALAEAMPPPFVAERSLQQLGAGKSLAWCAPFYMVRTDDAAIVGSCGFKDMPKQGRVEIGYGVAPQARRQGMAGAAVAQLLALANASDEVREVLAQVSPANGASTRVVQRMGFLPCGQQLDHEGEMLVQWVCRMAQRVA